jgi:inositol-phosphate transport system ATP-binding protein
MADRIICMRAGLIEQIGTPDDLYLTPSSLFVASFIGSPPINLIAGEARDGTLAVNAARIPLEGPSGPLTVGLRPEHLRFADSGFAGRVLQVEPMGREILYVAETEIGTVRVLEQGSSAARSLGQEVRIGFPPENSLVFDSSSQRLISGAHVRTP